jgi:HSP20 family protein
MAHRHALDTSEEGTMARIRQASQSNPMLPLLRSPFLPTPRFPSLTSAMEDFTERTNEMIRAAAGGTPFLPSTEWYPAVNVSENAQEYTLSAELPGMTAKDVSVDYCDGVLTIRGEKDDKAETKEEEEDRRWYIWERRFGAFQRSIPFPGGIAEDRIAAEFKDGVLTVRLPKHAEGTVKHHPITVVEK